MTDYTALVVEDSPTMRQLLVSALGQMGELKILEAEDGVDGLKQMREHQIDILITDINMPMMDGLKLVGMVRKDPKHRDIPIIIVTTRVPVRTVTVDFTGSRRLPREARKTLRSRCDRWRLAGTLHLSPF